MTAPETSGAIEPLCVAGKYYETLPLDISVVADGSTLALFGSRAGGQWGLNVCDFTNLTTIPDDEHMLPELGEITTEADPHPLDSSASYDFAHRMAADWLIERGLRISQHTPRVRAYGNIVCFYVVKSPSE